MAMRAVDKQVLSRDSRDQNQSLTKELTFLPGKEDFSVPAKQEYHSDYYVSHLSFSEW